MTPSARPTPVPPMLSRVRRCTTSISTFGSRGRDRVTLWPTARCLGSPFGQAILRSPRSKAPAHSYCQLVFVRVSNLTSLHPGAGTPRRTQSRRFLAILVLCKNSGGRAYPDAVTGSAVLVGRLSGYGCWPIPAKTSQHPFCDTEHAANANGLMFDVERSGLLQSRINAAPTTLLARADKVIE
jgi:hypothetical protein